MQYKTKLKPWATDNDILICKWCGNEYNPKILGTMQYTCSNKCYQLLHLRTKKGLAPTEIKNCLTCGNEFSASIKKGGRFCSKVCKNNYTPELRFIGKCIICNSEFKTNIPQRKTCSDKCRGILRAKYRKDVKLTKEQKAMDELDRKSPDDFKNNLPLGVPGNFEQIENNRDLIKLFNNAVLIR